MKKRVGRHATRRPKSCLEKIKHKKRELGSSSSQLHVASPMEQLQTQQYQPPMTYMQLLVGQQLHTPLRGLAHLMENPRKRKPSFLWFAREYLIEQQQAIDEPQELPSSSAAVGDADLKHEEPEIKLMLKTNPFLGQQELSAGSNMTESGLKF
ncbi:hypothetical protein Nepgr_001904 [Nepenthes gracilis]|uniref:Uncharacterized protein n=1 Tax=Nepenthes gracilis TaxID=150966 RepID=A0AAD3RY39_NEPGR|nr:hypothetical protein Nepgr_001904 [Nepenthes gracilis]